MIFCREIDSSFDKAEYIIEFVLSNQETIYMYEDGKESFISKLQKYCRYNNLSISKIYVICSKGRWLLLDNITNNKILFLNKFSWFSGIPSQMIVVGIVNNNDINTSIYTIPNFMLFSQEIRDFDKYKDFVI